MFEHYYRILDSIKEDPLSPYLHFCSETILKVINNYFSPVVKIYFTNINERGVPYSNFALDPIPVKQVKKIINAIYYAEIAAKDIEDMELRNHKWQALNKLYSSTISNAHNASYLFTNFDFDLKDFMEGQISLISDLLNSWQNLTVPVKNISSGLSIDQIYKTGWVTGIVFDQLHLANTNQVDYDFITKVSAIFPFYIKQATNFIHNFAPQLLSLPAPVEPQILEQLQEESSRLLVAIDNLQHTPSLIIFKMPGYINIVKKLILISTRIFSQLSNLNEVSENIIADYVRNLKEQIIPELLALGDELEVEALLSPGTFTKSLEEKLKIFYDTVIFYTEKIVDFSKQQSNLTEFADENFINLRLQNTIKRLDAIERKILVVEEIQDLAHHPDAISTLATLKLSSNLHQEIIRSAHVSHPELAEIQIESTLLAAENYADNVCPTLLLNESMGSMYKESLKFYAQQVAPQENQKFYASLSNFLNNMRQILFKNVEVLFNAPTQILLQPAPAGIPFPEIEEKYCKMPAQVLAFMRIYNVLYSLEQALTQLSLLDSNDYKLRYIYHVLQVFRYIHESFTTTRKIIADPYLNMIAGDLLQQGKIRGNFLSSVIAPYDINVPFCLAEQGQNDLQLNVNKYGAHYLKFLNLINGLLVLPTQIQYGNTQDATAKIIEQRKLARDITKQIEEVIIHSNSYMYLFLSSSKIYSLFNSLKQQLNLNIDVTDKLFFNNLANMNEQIFAKILDEADNFEDNLFLKPGLITDKLQVILNLYYQGLLEPLDINLKTYNNLISNVKSIESRIAKIDLRVAEVVDKQTHLEDKYKNLHIFIEALKRYQNFPNTRNTNRMCQAYLQVIPIAKEPLKQPFAISFDDKHAEIDQILYQASLKLPLGENFADLPQSNIVDRLYAHYANYCQNYNSLQHLVNSANEKAAYLTMVKIEQINNSEKVNKVYLNKILDRNINNAQAPLEFFYMAEEYKKQLQIHLQNCKTNLQELIINSNYDDLEMHQLINQEIAVFGRYNFLTWFSLEKVTTAINHFEQYLNHATQQLQSQCSLFESGETLVKKRQLVTDLAAIVAKTELPPQQRLAQVRNYIQQHHFQITMLNHNTFHFGSWQWLKQKVLFLLSNLNLYTLPYMHELKVLNNSIIAQPSINARAQFNFFPSTVPPRRYEAPSVVEENNNLLPL